MSEIIERGAEAMRQKRRELIAQPLDRIWPDLMRAAVEAMREPSEAMVCVGDEKIIEALHDLTGILRNPTPVAAAYEAMIDAALEGEK